MERRISRRDFLGGVVAAGTLPALFPGDAAAQTGPPPPTNVRLVSAVQPPPAATTGRQLIGGWRLAQDFARGPIAIDFATMRCWMVGHQQSDTIMEYRLPPMGSGEDLKGWPRVDPVGSTPKWWPDIEGSYTYCHGLAFWKGKVWASPRVFYAGAGIQGDGNLVLYAQDGETITVPLPRQKFAGFVKRGPGLEPYIGGCGYQSGQGSVAGPTLATMGGQVLISYGWPGSPGANLEYWNDRAPRDPNYSLEGGGDSWVAWTPRSINGKLEGRWASDLIYGGGLVLPEGITYWPIMGVGELNYGLQSLCFAKPGNLRTYEYRYDPSTYKLTSFALRDDFRWMGVGGQELGPDGKVYLAHREQWASGVYEVDVALKVYG